MGWPFPFGASILSHPVSSGGHHHHFGAFIAVVKGFACMAFSGGKGGFGRNQNGGPYRRNSPEGACF
jgi:hypothetical protein